MSYWRWLLFAAMALVELREDIYLGLPNATTIPHEVAVDGRGDGSNSNGR